MKNSLKAFVLATVLLVPAATAHAQVSIGIQIGAPPAPHAYRVPRQPGPGYEWVEGYQYPVNGHYKWHDGYWTRPPYEGAYWESPYYAGGHYYAGQWEGERGVIAHDHKSDKSRNRDDHR